MSTPLHHNSTPHHPLTIQHPSPLPYTSSVLRHRFSLPTEAPHILHSSNITNSHYCDHLSFQPAHMTDVSYPESHLRTPIYALPFPHPKWHVKAGTGEAYEVTNPIWEEYDAEVGYVNSVGEIKESIEGYIGVEGVKRKNQKEDKRKTKRRLDSIDGASSENVRRKRFKNAEAKELSAH